MTKAILIDECMIFIKPKTKAQSGEFLIERLDKIVVIRDECGNENEFCYDELLSALRQLGD